eukprot:1896894-Prymnesium_polylepis.1
MPLPHGLNQGATHARAHATPHASPRILIPAAHHRAPACARSWGSHTLRDARVPPPHRLVPSAVGAPTTRRVHCSVHRVRAGQPLYPGTVPGCCSSEQRASSEAGAALGSMGKLCAASRALVPSHSLAHPAALFCTPRWSGAVRANMCRGVALRVLFGRAHVRICVLRRLFTAR